MLHTTWLGCLGVRRSGQPVHAIPCGGGCMACGRARQCRRRREASRQEQARMQRDVQPLRTSATAASYWASFLYSSDAASCLGVCLHVSAHVCSTRFSAHVCGTRLAEGGAAHAYFVSFSMVSSAPPQSSTRMVRVQPQQAAKCSAVHLPDEAALESGLTGHRRPAERLTRSWCP
jgi:hypothetical protein